NQKGANRAFDTLLSFRFEHLRLSQHVCECATAPRKASDGQQEVRCLRRIGSIDDDLGDSLGGEKAGIAAFPRLDLPIEENAASLVVRQSCKQGIDPP